MFPPFFVSIPAPRPSRPRIKPLHTPLCRARVPNDATSAAVDIQSCVRTALIAGRQRLCVDVLTAAVDPRARTYDASSAAVLTRALVAAIQPVLPAERPIVQLVVPGPTTALRVREWLSSTNIQDVSVAVLGVGEQSPDERHKPHAYVILDPPAKGDAILDFRRLVQSAQKDRLPVIVHNHPREDSLYSMLGFGGTLPYELTKFEPVFVLAPFALQPKGEQAENPNTPPPRFVVLRMYPGKWALWRFVGTDADPVHPRETDPVEMEQLDDYTLCEEFDSRPTDNQLVSAVQRALR